MKYKLENDSKENINSLIEYKLASILDFADNLDNKEIQQIKEYVYNSVPKQIKDYKIIKINNKVIGCLLLEPYEDGILLDEIYLESNYRGKGIGSNIINSILNKYAIVYLWVYKNNKIAVELYNKLGFVVKEITETRFFMKCEENKSCK